jgi:hypothetical protein
MRSVLAVIGITLAIGGWTMEPGPFARPAGDHVMTITSLHYLGNYIPSDRVHVFRGQPAAIEVDGSLLDLSTGVEVRTATGAATSSVAATIGKRTGGDNTSIIVNVTSTPDAPLGDYQVLIHYAIETNGPDRFKLQMFDHGTVDNIGIVESMEGGIAFVTGRSYTLSLSGNHLENATLDVVKAGITDVTKAGTSAGATVTPVSSSAFGKRFSIQFHVAGTFTITADDFFDQSLSTRAPVPCSVQCYDGVGSLRLSVIVAPSIASVSTRTPNAGTTVTISGAGLINPLFATRLVAKQRYGLDGATSSPALTASGTGLSFVANANTSQDPMHLEFRPSGNLSSAPFLTLALPTIAVQGGTPEVARLETDTLTTVSSGKRAVMLAGNHAIRGKFLVANPLQQLLTLASPPPTTLSTATLSPTNTTLNTSVTSTSAPTQPTLRYQTSLDVATARYDPTQRLAGTNDIIGVDIVTFSTPNFTDTLTADLKVTTPFGTTSVPGLVHIPPPTLGFIRRRFANGQTVVVSDGKLIKGASYEIGGTALVIVSNGTLLHFGTVRLSGATISTDRPLTAPGSTIIFTLPSTATSGPLTVQTIAGTTAPTNITVLEPPPPTSIAGFQLSPTDVVGGKPVTGTVAFSTTTPSGTVVFSQTPSSSPLTVSGPRTIAGNPLTFTMPTKVTRVPVTTTVNASIGELPAGTSNTASAVLNIVPPTPTSLALSNASVVGGTTATATIQMTGAATPADSILITLTNTDPTSATVPASVILNGTAATVQIPTQVVPTTRTLTITASSGGQTRTATLIVNPPTVATVTPASASVIGRDSVNVTLGLTAPVPVAQTVAISCTGVGLTCPTTASVTGSSGSFFATIADVPTARQGTVTATLNGVARSGTIDMQPISIATMTASPSTVAAGASSSITFQLSHLGATTLTLSSSDSTVIVPPRTVSFSSTQLTQLVTIPTRAPQAQTKTVTITASGLHVTPLGNATFTKSVTVTVTP